MKTTTATKKQKTTIHKAVLDRSLITDPIFQLEQIVYKISDYKGKRSILFMNTKINLLKSKTS